MRRISLVIVCAWAVLMGALLVPPQAKFSDIYGVKPAVAGPVEVITGVQKSIKKVFNAGKKLTAKAKSLAKTNVEAVAQSKLVKDLAQAKKDEKQVRRYQKTVDKLRGELRKFKNAPKPPPINTIYNSATSTLNNAKKTLNRARSEYKKAIALLSGAIKQRADAVKRFASAQASSATGKKSKELLAQARSTLAKMKSNQSSNVRAVLGKLSSAQRRTVAKIGRLVAAGKTRAAESQLQKMIRAMPKRKVKALTEMDIRALTVGIVREAVLEQERDLKSKVAQVRSINSRKNAVMAEAQSLLAKANWKRELKKLEEKLKSVGDDAQLSNIDLQSQLKKAQRSLQAMSNVQKSLHDTAMAVIRKI